MFWDSTSCRKAVSLTHTVALLFQVHVRLHVMLRSLGNPGLELYDRFVRFKQIYTGETKCLDMSGSTGQLAVIKWRYVTESNGCVPSPSNTPVARIEGYTYTPRKCMRVLTHSRTHSRTIFCPVHREGGIAANQCTVCR